MKKYICMALAFIAGVSAVLGLCWALVAFISWEPNVAAWPTVGRFLMAVFGFVPALMAGVFAASVAGEVVA